MKAAASGVGLAEIASGLMLAVSTAYSIPTAAAPSANAENYVLGFTAEQAEAGKEAYDRHCSACHGITMEGSGTFPALRSEFFDARWGDKTADTLAQSFRRMPPDGAGDPSSITDAMYTNMMAYMLESNGVHPGAIPLPLSMTTLRRLRIPKVRANMVDLHAPNVDDRTRQVLISKSREATQYLLNNPDDDDWLHWGRTYSGHNFSPLTQINQDTVDRLQPAWTLPLHPAEAHATPLVHDGVMYLHAFPDSLVALDATTGDILWRYKHRSLAAPSGKLGIAIKGDRLFLPTSDLRLVALDSNSGQLIWEHQILTEVQNDLSRYKQRGYFLRSAPVVAGNHVIQGVAGPLVKQGAFVLAVNRHTGEEVWRFNTIPRPGEPGDNSWNGLPFEERSGGSVWHFGSYDPELNLVFYGVSQTYDTAALLIPSGEPGVSNEGLYTDSTVALDADSGKLVWHYQHQPAEQWDMDWAFERQIVEITHNGEPRKAVITLGKIGILDAVDAATGDYIFSVDLGIQNYITGIDPNTGEKLIDPEKLPHKGMDTIGCPHYVGVRNWPPTAYSPELKKLYVPIFETCGHMTISESANLTSGLYSKMVRNPWLPQDQLGRLISVNLENRRVEWESPHKSPISTGLLSTAGGLVFAGDLAPAFNAYDAESGDTVWQYELDQAPSAGVITYSVQGKQYIAVSVGITNNTTKQKAERLRLQTGIDTPVGKQGAALWIFSLQQSNQELQSSQ